MFRTAEFNASNGVNNGSVLDVINYFSGLDFFNNVSAFDVTNNVSLFDVSNNKSAFDVSSNVSGFDFFNNVSAFDVSNNVSAFDVSNNESVFDVSNNMSLTSNTTCDRISVCPRNLTPEIMKVLLAMEKYFYPPLLLFGIVTNALTLLTLRSSRLKESPYVYLTALAAADLLALLLILVETTITDLNNFAYTVYRIRVFYPLVNIAVTVGINIMMVLTIERCVFVKYPLWAPFKCTVHRAKMHTGIVFLFSLLVNLPRFFWYQITICPRHKEMVIVTAEHLYPDTLPTITWIHSVVHNFIPFLVMILLNPFMVYKVRLQQKKRCMLGVRNASNVQVWSREQLRLTKILIAIIFFFIVFVLPSAFADDPILRNILGNLYDTDQSSIYQRISNTLMLLNISGTFIMFSFINSKFLKAFREMLAGWRLGIVRLCTRERFQVGRFGIHRVLKRESSQAISLQLESSLSSQPQA